MPSWFSSNDKTNPDGEPTTDTATHEHSPIRHGDNHLDLAKESLSQLLNDERVPASVRSGLQHEYQRIRQMLDKLEQGQLHIAVFGRVSVGKSSVLNALIGHEAFSVSLLHGETKTADMEAWQEVDAGGVYLIDTPGINEIDGESREALAHEVANRADLLLFVVDSDLTDVELKALHTVAETKRPIILVVNKADQYNDKQKLELRAIIRDRVGGIIAPENIVFTAASPGMQIIIREDEFGNEHESTRQRPVDIINLKTRLWDIIEAEGKTLSALNASLFAGNLSEQVGERMLEVRKEIGERIIHIYCMGKGVAVALNPIPIADLVAAAAIDVGMIIHLSRIYGLPMSKTEAGELIKSIAAQMVLLYGSFWAVNLASSALKISTVGLSTVLTGAAQGAIAWYSTLVIGRAAENYLAKGKSWGDSGPKLAVAEILDSLDRDSVMKEAKEEIMMYLKQGKK
ncbi:MAG: GTP-binding protein HSR1 [Proteobacteria bacterium]|nr:MAG: GTP-binding protein HSR1 [Pseudomonadota bacterium]